MSYIRSGQDGQYVDIPGGSNYYIYDNGDDIEGWSYGEFAALIAGVMDEIERDGGPDVQSKGYVRSKFAEHFGDYAEDYGGGITPPERAEIFCQCVDKRIDDLELTPELYEAVRDWANEFDAMRTCKYCDSEFRPFIYEEPYICDDEQCDLRMRADRYDVDVSVIERGDRIFNHLHYDYDWSLEDASDEEVAYYIEQSPKDFE